MSNQNDIALQLQELIILNREQIAELKTMAAQLQKDNADFRTSIIKELADFKENINNNFSVLKDSIHNRISTFENKIDNKLSDMRYDINSLHSEIGFINQRITGIEHDITGLYHWDYWLLSAILFFATLPYWADIIKSIPLAISSCIKGVLFLFKKDRIKND